MPLKLTGRTGTLTLVRELEAFAQGTSPHIDVRAWPVEPLSCLSSVAGILVIGHHAELFSMLMAA